MVRMRIDGVLYDSYPLPKSRAGEVVSRIKVMGRMNIAEKRLSQDGRATVQVGDRTVDLRIASLPTSFGERVVDPVARQKRPAVRPGRARHGPRHAGPVPPIDHGRTRPDPRHRSHRQRQVDHALLGPDARINSIERNILTLEDPIEYQLEGISQTQVSDKKGMTFAKGLRSVLRQDPDVIMVGEIRDLETATMAIQSSLTGHLVFSTLHTNDAATAVTRLLDLGIEPYLVASSLMGVLAQRLVRRVCPDCSRPHPPTPADLRWLGVDRADGMRVGPGCPACRQTGYRGRLGAFELLSLDDSLRHLIGDRATAGQLKAAAVRHGTRTLRDDGIEKVLAGQTTITEVERVTVRLADDVPT